MHDALDNRRQPSVKGRGQLAGEALFGGSAQEVDVCNQVVTLANSVDNGSDQRRGVAQPARRRPRRSKQNVAISAPMLSGALTLHEDQSIAPARQERGDDQEAETWCRPALTVVNGTSFSGFRVVLQPALAPACGPHRGVCCPSRDQGR